MVYGYINLFVPGDDEAAQVANMNKARVAMKRIYIDRQPGENYSRPQLNAVLERLGAEDQLVVNSLNSLADTFQELSDVWAQITVKQNARVRVLNIESEGIEQPDNGTMSGLLNCFGQLSRNLQRQNQAKGIARARSEGKHLGPPMIERPKNFDEILGEWKRGVLSTRKAAARMGVSTGTFRSWVEADGATREESEEERLKQLCARYPEGPSDELWACMETVLNEENKNKRRRKTDNRSLMTAIFWKYNHNCPWNNLPAELGNWWRVYDCYADWKNTELLKKLLDAADAVDNQ